MKKIELIGKFDIISFDIFDTLVCRCVNKPTDVFDIVEKQYIKMHGVETSIKNFSKKRVAAERTSREHTNCEEITLDEVYKNIDAEDDICNEYKRIEKQVELDVCLRNPDVAAIFDECIRQGKRVIITSDMYLPYETIEQILQKNGYNGYKKIYLSCDVNKTKASGSLYKYIVDSEKVKPNRIIHFGDNIRSDIKNAIKEGWKTYYIKKKTNNCGVGIDSDSIGNFISYSNNRNDIFESVGYSAFGPLIYGFIDWVNKNTVDLKIDKIFFLSRDGFIMKQVYDQIRIDNEIQAHYMYASRRALQVAAIHLNPDYRSVMTSMFIPRTVSVRWLIKKWGLNEQDCAYEVSNLGLTMEESFAGRGVIDNSRVQSLYNDLKSKIVVNSLNEYRALLNYLESISFSGNVAIVDIGWYGNMQNALMKIVESSDIEVNITGYYLGIVPESNYQNKYHMNGYLFMKNKNENLFWKFKYLNSLMELFFMAPHGSAKRYYLENDTPMVELADFEFEGTKTFECIKKVQNSALEFISNYHKGIAKYIDNSSETYLNNMLLTFLNPTLRVANSFGELEIWDEKWIKIAPKPQIRSLKQDFLNAPWKNGYLKRLLKLPIKYEKIIANMKRLKRD